MQSAEIIKGELVSQGHCWLTWPRTLIGSNVISSASGLLLCQQGHCDAGLFVGTQNSEFCIACCESCSCFFCMDEDWNVCMIGTNVSDAVSDKLYCQLHCL